MKSALCFISMLVCSVFTSAANYQLADHSVFITSAGAQALSGSFAVDFAFGVPPSAASNNITYYHFDSFDLSSGGQNFGSVSFDENFSTLLLEDEANVVLPSGAVTPFLSPIYLDANEIASGDDFITLRVLSLTPLFSYEDDEFSLLARGSDYLPAYIQLGYDVRETVMRWEQASPREIISTVSLGVMQISATPVPIPAASWLFLSAVGGLIVARRNTYT